MSTFTITHLDGSVSQRTSKSHDYRYAVVVVVPWSHVRAEAERYIAGLRSACARCEATLDTDSCAARNLEIYQGRLAKAEAELAEMPTAGDDYQVWAWSATEANALKRASALRGRLAHRVEVAPVDARAWKD